MTNSKKAKRFQFWINVVLILITLSIVLPFVLVFISSLTDENTLIRNGYSFFPEKFSFYAYSYIIRQGEKILRAYGITIFVTIVGTAANIAMSSLLAYPLSVKKLPYRRAITFFVFFTMLFNGGLVPTYLMYVNYLHIKNTIWALIVPGFLLSANNVLMIRSYFNTSIPDALFEAAKIDGAGHMKIFTSITLPLGKPILVTMGLFSALGYWNDWTNGLYYLSGNDGQYPEPAESDDHRYSVPGKWKSNRKYRRGGGKAADNLDPYGNRIYRHAAAVYHLSVPSEILRRRYHTWRGKGMIFHAGIKKRNISVFPT